ncbi:diaminopimelate decarboxylase family protein [Streptomyces colonosanans]|uniref:diaminopimelate decarboxylase family protein n=1 Tax=Streptomyces colonosanans TaxID=1428652 RepID=UPI0009A0DE64|nr:hypothetical protein [Streptomyces colonosanans]
MATEVKVTDTHGIDPVEITPRHVPYGPDGVDRVEGVPLATLLREYGSPLWVFSSAQLRGNFHELRDAAEDLLGSTEIAYSMKANNNRAVLQTLVGEGAFVDCSSEYELQIAVQAGTPANRIIVNGNGKAESYLTAAAALGVRQINVDSSAEVRRLERIARELGVTVDCVVRVKLGYQRLLTVDPSYERTLRVAEAKFGSSTVTGEAIDVANAITDSDALRFRGLSHHAGFAGYRANYRPELQTMHLRECAREMSEFAGTLRGLGIDTERLDVGGGLRSGKYVMLSTPGDGGDAAYHPLPSTRDYVAAVRQGIDEGWGNAPRPVVQFETGGFQVANSCVLLTTIQDVKDTEHFTHGRFLTVDTAATMFTSRGSSRVGYPVFVAGKGPDHPVDGRPVEVVGPTCAYDSIAEDIALPDVEVGDVLVVLNQGAYSEMTSTQFNGIPRPAVAMVDGEAHRLVRRRETLSDITQREVSPATLWPTTPSDEQRAGTHARR